MPDVKRRWIEERERDVYHRKAKELGYRSRAAFKLMQIDKAFKLLKQGARVIDLGSSPGGWTQYAAEIAGLEGLIVAVDAADLKDLGMKQVRFIRADVMKPDLESSIGTALARGSVDLVMSDLAPNMTGRYEVDHERQIALAERALEIAEVFLKIGGNLVVKVFEGKRSLSLERRAGSLFEKIKKFRPAASRKRSSECYLVCLGFSGSNPAPEVSQTTP
ncbi:MAG TPA: RlmE family RNA methyltransferase [Thermoproteota archaeon]|nr:RlmE family RNA methyltransferase [Thermoproteota archaeon]